MAFARILFIFGVVVCVGVLFVDGVVVIGVFVFIVVRAFRVRVR